MKNAMDFKAIEPEPCFLGPPNPPDFFTHRIESAKCSEAGGSFSVCLCVWWVFLGEVKAETGWFHIFKYLLFYRQSYRKTQKVKNPSHTQTTPIFMRKQKK